MSFHGRCKGLRETGLSLKPLSAGLDRKWGFFFFDLPCFFWGWGGTVPIGQREGWAYRSLWLRVSPFFFPLFFKKSDSCVVFLPKQPRPIPGSCFSGKFLRAPSHPSTLLSLPQHLLSDLTAVLCTAARLLHSLVIQRPLNGGWDGAEETWEGQEEKEQEEVTSWFFFFNCSVAAISLSLSLLEAYFYIYKYIKKQVKLGCIKLKLLSEV